eukprot:TRINITY_DN7398_c0_g1_i4.p1 TRINITY_DN7398_c0_g1~~TRINITY_DN7398_c0_g1_i4.p1  ORF type:complete len:511 (-),score=85.71 TRINITY_DN7398_c0_g1_i4:41-1573(-)
MCIRDRYQRRVRGSDHRMHAMPDVADEAEEEGLTSGDGTAEPMEVRTRDQTSGCFVDRGAGCSGLMLLVVLLWLPWGLLLGPQVGKNQSASDMKMPASVVTEGLSDERMVERDAANVTRVLFVGNSFTYGPQPVGQPPLNNLPRLFKLVAESLGRNVTIGEDTIGGCTLDTHKPSVNPEGAAPCSGATDGYPSNCQVVQNARVNASLGCTVRDGISFKKTYHPCPQLLTRAPWDWVVLQDFSAMPTVQPGREQYMQPAIQEYVEVAQRLATQPKVAVYMTWAYPDGGKKGTACPGGSKAGCFPDGTLKALLKSSGVTCHEWHPKVENFECQSYAQARGTANAARESGADVVVPAGIAWQMARRITSIPQSCIDLIDAEYSSPASSQLPLMPLPLIQGHEDSYPANLYQMYRWLGEGYNSSWCADCHNDHHASVIGMYLNACVFYATLFGESPVGAAAPAGQIVDGHAVPGEDTVLGDGTTGAMPKDQALLLQEIAAAVVLPNLEYWQLKI